MKTEYAWVIQRDDGMFYVTTCSGKRKRNIFDSHLISACKEDCKSEAEETIKIFNLQNCKPVKVELKVVENGEV